MKPLEEDLEKSLKSLIPVSPSTLLKLRIEQSLIQDAPTPWRWWRHLALGAAASLALASSILLTGPTDENRLPALVSSGPSSLYLPVQAEQRLIEAFDEGVIRDNSNKLVRQLRYQFVDTVTLKNQLDGSVFTLEVPREEIIHVPVALL